MLWLNLIVHVLPSLNPFEVTVAPFIDDKQNGCHPETSSHIIGLPMYPEGNSLCQNLHIRVFKWLILGQIGLT